MATKTVKKKAAAPKKKAKVATKRVVKTVKRAKKATPRKKKRTLKGLLISLVFAGLAFAAWKKGYRRLSGFFVLISAAFGITWLYDLDLIEAGMQIGVIVMAAVTVLATTIFSLINLFKPSLALRIAKHLNLK